MRRILIRVDATPEIGTGHLMRMVALGQLLGDDGYNVHFATLAATLPIAANNFSLHRLSGPTAIGSAEDAAELVALGRLLSPAWVVLDGDAFGTEYQRAVKESGARVMSVDDLGRGHFVSDLILNQNYGAERLVYSAPPGTKKLLGTRHVLLRREFWDVDHASRQAHEPPANVLVTLGGGSHAGAAALRALLPGLAATTQPGVRFRVLTGVLDESLGDLRAHAASGRFALVERSDNMAEEMRRADVAICSGGSTVWELMHMRVPFVAVALNAPQVEFLSTLEHYGLCINLGPHSALDTPRVQRVVESFLMHKEQRDRMLESAEGLVDPVHSRRTLLAALDAP